MGKFDDIQDEADIIDSFLDGQFGASVDEAFAASQSITNKLQQLTQEELDEQFEDEDDEEDD